MALAGTVEAHTKRQKGLGRSCSGLPATKQVSAESQVFLWEKVGPSPGWALALRMPCFTFNCFLIFFNCLPLSFSRNTHASRTNIVVEQSFSQESILTPVERSDCVWGITISTIVQAGPGGRVFSRSQTCKKQESLQEGDETPDTSPRFIEC